MIKLRNKHANYINDFGITYDHSQVNITFLPNGDFVSLEVHKCSRDYLFNISRFEDFINQNYNIDHDVHKILKRLKELIKRKSA